MSDRRFLEDRSVHRASFEWSALAVALIAATACTSPAPHALPPPPSDFALHHATHRASMDEGGRMQVTPTGAQASLSLKLESVTRGARSWLMRAPLRREVDAGGALVAHWPNAVDETWASEARGLEQTFVLQRPPPGAGDVVVHLSTGGLDYAGRGPAGHRFKDPRSAVGFVYGEAFASVSGARRALEVRRSGDGLDIVVPDALAREAAWPLIIDPLLAVDPPVPLAPGGPQLKPKIVWAANAYVAAWVDGRGMVPQVYYARLSEILTPESYGQPLTNAPSGVSDVGVACDTGMNCVFVWTVLGQPTTAMFTYLPNTGTPTPTSGTLVETASSVATSSPAVAVGADGRFFIAYAAGTPPQIRGAWFDPAVQSGPALLGPLGASGYAQFAPVVACGPPGEALIAWEETAGVPGVSYALWNNALAVSGTPIPSGQSAAVAWSGTQYHLAWEGPNLLNQAIYGLRVDSADAGTSGMSLQTLLFDDVFVDDVRPAVGHAPSASGAGVQLTWTRGQTINSVRWPSSGTMGASAPVVMGDGPEDHSSVACSDNSANCVAVWEGGTGPGFDIYGAVIQQPVLRLISVVGNDELRPSIAAIPSGFFVAWSDSRGPQGLDVYGELISPLATPMTPVQLGVGPGDDDYVDVASNNSDSFAVAWSNASGNTGTVLAVTVDAMGQISSGPAQLSTESIIAEWPSLAWDGQHFVAVWQENGMTTSIMSTAFSSLGGGGAPPPMIVDHALSTLAHPAVAATPSTILVAWADSSLSSDQLRLRRLNTSLAPLDTSSFSVPNSTVSAKALPSVATDGANFLVVWTDVNNLVRASRVTAAGTVLDVTGGAVIGQGHPHVSAGFDGTNWAVVWQLASSVEDSPILETHIAPDGGRVGVTPLSDAGAVQDVAFGPSGAAMAFERFDPAVQDRRVMVLTFAPGVGADGGTSTDGGASPDGGRLPDAGTVFNIECNPNPYAAVGEPYVFDAQGRIVTNPPDVKATFAACPNDAGLEVDALTGAVSWIPQAVGTYSFCVEATPPSGGPVICPVTVNVTTVMSPGPDAGFRLAPSTVDAGQPVTVDGTPSTTIAPFVYRWDFGDMSQLRYGLTQHHAYALPGSYQIELTVVDRFGRSAKAKAPVRVLDSQGHVPPLALIDVAPQPDGHTFELSCGTCDSALLLFWDFGDVALSGPKTLRPFPPGRHRVRLRALDTTTGLAGNDQVMIRVDDPVLGAPPDCHAYVEPVASPAPATFRFFADGLFDTSGGIHNALYTFSDGGVVALADRPNRTLASPGAERGQLFIEAVNGLACRDNARAVALGAMPGDAPPRFEPIDTQLAMCGTPLDFVPLVEGTRPLAFSGTLPPGVTLDPTTGELKGTFPAPSQLPVNSQGAFPVSLHVTNSAGADDVTFDIRVQCLHDPNLDFQTQACGCGAAGGAPLLLLALGRLLRRRR